MDSYPWWWRWQWRVYVGYAFC